MFFSEDIILFKKNTLASQASSKEVSDSSASVSVRKSPVPPLVGIKNPRVLVTIDFQSLFSRLQGVRGFGVELTIMAVVAITATAAHADTFNGILTSYQNTSDAFKVVAANRQVNQKLMSIAALTGSDKGNLPKMLSLASASEAHAFEEEGIVSGVSDKNTSNILTTGDSSAIVKPTYAVPPGIGSDEGIGTYKVAEGDTPVTIAGRFGVSVATVLIENHLYEDSVIKPGQELRILATDGITYEVKEGDSLSALAERFKVTEDAILDANFRETDEGLLAAGTTIAIPKEDLQIPQDPTSKSKQMKLVSNKNGQIGLTTATASAVAAASGKLIWPTDSRVISQHFSYRHDGIDITSQGQNPGHAIYAADDGFVEIAGWMAGGWGNNIVINHGNGIKTRYAHMSLIDVKAGDEVKQGQKIGNIGNTGRSTGPHLHYMVYVNGKPTNPLLYAQP